jgi:hypothetical protein
MARLRTKEAFRQYILHKLGSPLLDLVLQIDETDDCASPGTSGTGITGTESPAITASPEAILKISGNGCQEFAESTMIQLDLACDDALDYYGKLASGVGNEKALLLVQLKANQMVYSVPSCIIAIEQPMNQGTSRNITTGGEDFDSEESSAGANGLFSFENTIGGVGINTYMTDGSGYNLLTYEIAAQYIALVDLRYSIKFEVDFSETEKQVVVYPTPSGKDNNRVIAFRCSRIVQDEYLFSDIWVQRYAVALAKMQIGMNMSMYTGFQLPGGGEFNASFYYDNGKEERDKLEEELMTGKWGNQVAGSIMFTG